LALERILAKGKPVSRQPVRVYPCDTCERWHLAAKPNKGKTPPWDLDPNWKRPEKLISQDKLNAHGSGWRAKGMSRDLDGLGMRSGAASVKVWVLGFAGH
jgi:hypothetical protein